MNQNLGAIQTRHQSTHSSPILIPSALRLGLLSALSRAVVACAIALVVLASSVQAQTTLTWIASSGTFSTPANWDIGIAPSANGDTVIFTNEASFAVSLSANTPFLHTAIFSNHTGVITINNNAFTWQVTNAFRVATADATTTVLIANGTLNVGDPLTDAAQLRIGDSLTNAPNQNSVGKLIVDNATVSIDTCSLGSGVGSNSVGTLVVTDNGSFTANAGGSTITIGVTSYGSQLIVTNGGKLFVDGTITVGNNEFQSNCLMMISGPASAGTISSTLKFTGNGSQLILSNGAILYDAGSLSFGSNSSGNTGVVDGAGTQLIVKNNFYVGANGGGGTNNLLTVQNGAFVSNSATFAYGNNSYHIHDGFVMGGVGAMSTGVFAVVRSASNSTNHDSNFITITNALMVASYFNPQGPIETASVLAKGVLKLTNNTLYTSSGSNAINFACTGGTFTINGGTVIDPQTADNAGGISIGGAGGNTFVITNGGFVLSAGGTLTGSYNTGLVSGASTIWSNTSSINGWTNIMVVGTGGGSNNFLGVFNGASVYNNGTFNIGNSPTTSVNTVQFGGPGLPVTIVNAGSLNVGSGSNTFGNVLNVTNATVTTLNLNVGNSNTSNNTLVVKSGGLLSATFMRVRPTNTVAFSGGTLSMGGSTVDTLADNNGPFVVGDGTSSATYVLAAGGTGYHNFNNGGLVVTNGAALIGTGIVVGNVTNLGIFSPGIGASVGTILFSNNLVFGSTAALNYHLGTLQDSVAVSNNLTLGGTVNVIGGAGFGANTYVLFTYSNLVASGTLTVGTLPGGFSATVSTNTVPLVQLIVTAGGGGDPYTTWATHYGLSGGNALGTADPDGDGMNNTNEFLAGFNPTSSSAYVHITSISKTNGGTDVRVDYLGASGDNTYTGGPTTRTNVLEFTAGTANGSYSTNNFASTGVTNILSGGTGLGTLSNMVDPGGATNKPSRYYRIRVIVP